MFFRTLRTFWDCCILPVILVMPLLTWANPTTVFVKATSLWQIEVAPLDGATPPQPVYNTSFELFFDRNGKPADPLVLKVWEASKSTTVPSTFLNFSETFMSPVSVSALDSCYGTCKPGYSYFFLTTADTGLYNIYIKPSNLVSSIHFYLPVIEYYDSLGAEITSLSSLNLLTGQTLAIHVKALYPNGITDTTFNQSLIPAVSDFSFFEKGRD